MSVVAAARYGRQQSVFRPVGVSVPAVGELEPWQTGGVGVPTNSTPGS